MTRHVLFAGNPGAGKSTLLNCLMMSENYGSLDDKNKFKSGVAVATGMTYKMDRKVVNDVVYLDTPGLSDTKKRKAASQAITEALKQNGEYQVVFVVTLESGRIRPDDVATINLILQSAKEIQYYGVIINKLKRNVKNKLENGGCEQLLSEIAHGEGPKPIPCPLLLERIDQLDDEDDKVANIPAIKKFLDQHLPPLVIHSSQVDKISDEKFEEMKEMFEAMLAELREDNERLRQKMEQDRRDFEEQLAHIRNSKPNFEPPMCTIL